MREFSSRFPPAISQVRQWYDNSSALYDFNHLHSIKRYDRVEASMCELLERGRVLDLGCGTGRLLQKVSGRRGIGVDLSHKMLKMGRPSLAVAQADGHRLPFADECFDSIVAAQAVIRYMRLPALFQEISRVLKPGGQCAVHQFGQPWTARGLLGNWCFSSEKRRAASSGSVISSGCEAKRSRKLALNLFDTRFLGRGSKIPYSLESIDQLLIPSEQAGLRVKKLELWRTIRMFPHALRIPSRIPGKLWNQLILVLQKPWPVGEIDETSSLGRPGVLGRFNSGNS